MVVAITFVTLLQPDGPTTFGVRGTVQELGSVLTRARMWRYKPDGDVTYMTAQDEYGTPVPTWQDPLHYPHDTKFLAPGAPLSSMHSIDSLHGLRLYKSGCMYKTAKGF